MFSASAMGAERITRGHRRCHAGALTPAEAGWLGLCRDGDRDLIAFAAEVTAQIGYSLHEVQRGREPHAAKALKGFGGRGILESIENHDGSTYRVVYTVRFAEIVYVLHCFQKKSIKGIATPQKDIELIKTRLKMVEADFAMWKRG